MPSLHGGDDLCWILYPAKGRRVGIGIREEPLDGRLEFDNRAEHAAQQAPLGKLGEVAFDSVQPGRRRRGEVERPARVALQPLLDLRMFVRRVVVNDGVDGLALGNGSLGDVRKRCGDPTGLVMSTRS